MYRDNGFTLLEILIALVVFAILATITSSSLFYAFNTRTRITQQAERMVDAQLALSLLQRDTEQLTFRAVRGNDMRLFPILIGNPAYIEFTRGGLANPASIEKRSELQRVAYICKKNELIKRRWTTLDSVNRQNFEDKVLLTNLTQCQFGFLDKTLHVLPEWHESSLDTDGIQTKEVLPKAIRFDVTLKDWGLGSFLFPLPGGLYADVA